MTEVSVLPDAIRYIKNGAGGKWWRRALEQNELHAGWNDYPHDAIKMRDVLTLTAHHGSRQTQDLNALLTLLKGSQYTWVTIQDGYLWWCTVTDEITVDEQGSNDEHGHFWLTCSRPWSNRSLTGTLLSVGSLPGSVTQIAGYRATVCEPSAFSSFSRIINGETDPDVLRAGAARSAYVETVSALVARLTPKDFELLIDLILARTGWSRIAQVGGTVEGVDVEAENAATGEIAFVQVKSRASQEVLADFENRFSARRERYARMIFAVHTISGTLLPLENAAIHIWDRGRIADLVVSQGLSDWLGRRV